MELEWDSPQNPFSDENATASLFIGDDALFLKYHQDKNLYYYDIGQQWKEFTNLCMVYAVWVVRKDFAQENPQKTSIIQQYIKNGFANGFTNLHQAIKEIARDKPLSVNVIINIAFFTILISADIKFTPFFLL